MSNKKIVDVHIFSPGTQTSAQGVTREFTKKDLQEVAKNYNPGLHEAPIRVGHQDDDKVPSWGWVKDVKMKGQDLYAEVEFSPQMGQFIRDGLYKKVSASFYAPESKINPEPGKWSLRHVAMLGAQPPAVKGLKGFAYSEESVGEGVFDFATEVKLSPEQVFDEELGPTLKSDQSPLETLKQKLDEARSEMAKEEKAELEAQATNDQLQAQDGQEEFAEMPKKKKAPAGKMGAEDAEEEISEDEADTMDNKESDAKKDRKMAAKDVSEARYDARKGKKKRAGELMADADQDNEDADVDDERGYAEGATAERQGKVVKIGAPKHDEKMVKAPDEESEGPGPEVKGMKKEYKTGNAMQDPNKDEYLTEQKQQYDEGRAYKDVADGEALQDPHKGKYRKEQNQQYEEAQHGEETKGKMRPVKKELDEGEAMQDPRKGDYRKDQEAQYEEGRAKNYKHGDAMQDVNEGKLPPDMPKSKKKLVYSEVAVPAGTNVEEYREGFSQAVLAYREASLIGGDVEFAEDDEVTDSFRQGVEDGLEFAEAEFLQDGKPKAAGAPKHDKKMVDSPDEETDIPGKDTPSAKGPGQPESGKSEIDDVGEYQEPTFDPRGPGGSTKKRGTDNLNSSDVGVKQAGKMEMRYEEDEDSAEHKEVFKTLPDGTSESKDNRPGRAGNVKPKRPDTKDYKSKTKVKATKTLVHGDDGLTKRPPSLTLGRQNDQSGRGETGEAGEEGKTFRARGGDTTAAEGTGTDYARAQTGTDGGAQDTDRRNTGASKEVEAHRRVTGISDQDESDRGQAVSLGGYPGSGSAVKKPSVRVMYVGKKPSSDKPLVANFSEMEVRLAELEAANAKLVQEKIAAEKAAHRAQLTEFAESLYATGRLTNAVVDQAELVDYMEGLEYGTLEFSEGETPASKLMELLAALPAQVSFAEVAGGNQKEHVMFDDLDPHEKALRLTQEEGLDYAEALKKTLFTAE